MCRLLLLYNTSHTEKKIHSFLLQSTRQLAFTPHIKYPDAQLTKRKSDDGFGFSYMNTHIHPKIHAYPSDTSDERRSWKTYKKTGVYTEDTHFERKIKEISSYPIILGQLRRKIIGDISIVNTPPYTYRNHVFLHNGVIIQYTKHYDKIVSMIAPKYKKHIKGETDSEHIFYLLLTEIDKLKKKMTNEEVMNVCVSHLFELLIRENIYFHMNIIYANHTHIIVTRYSHLRKKLPLEKSEPLPLYIDSSDGLVISSEPITPNYMLLPENNIMTIPIF